MSDGEIGQLIKAVTAVVLIGFGIFAVVLYFVCKERGIPLR